MKRFINIMTIASASVSSIIIIFTILISHQFININQLFYFYEPIININQWFCSYAPIQFAVSTTMTFLAFRFWLNEHGIKKIVYAVLSLSISLIFLLSIGIVK